jgi:hypothetical protein
MRHLMKDGGETTLLRCAAPRGRPSRRLRASEAASGFSRSGTADNKVDTQWRRSLPAFKPLVPLALDSVLLFKRAAAPPAAAPGASGRVRGLSPIST